MASLTPREAATATHSNKNAVRSAFFGAAETVDGDETLTNIVDSRLIRLIHNLPVLEAISWRRNLSLSAVSFDFYNTIDWDWLLLMYNGFVSPSHIPVGATLNIPDVTTLRPLLQGRRAGNTVTI